MPGTPITLINLARSAAERDVPTIHGRRFHFHPKRGVLPGLRVDKRKGWELTGDPPPLSFGVALFFWDVGSSYYRRLRIRP